MTNILAIKGAHDTGKTTTAWLVYLLLRDYASSIRFWLGNEELTCPQDKIYIKPKDTDDTQTTQLSASTPDPCTQYQLRDFYAVLTIRGKVYIINSPGDDKETILNGLNWALRFEPDAIISGSRTKASPNIANIVDKEFATLPLITFYPSATISSTLWTDYLTSAYKTACDIVSYIIPNFIPQSAGTFVNNILK